MNESQIIELVRSLGADAYSAFIWWLICNTIIQPIVIIYGFWLVIWCTVKTIRKWIVEDEERKNRR